MFFYDYIIVTILVFTRIASMFSVIPLFGAANTPLMAKVGLILFLSLILVPMQLPLFNIEIETVLELSQYIFTESLIGFAMGLITLIVMNAFYLAGYLVDGNIGFAMVSVIGARDESELPVSANFYYLFAITIFVLANVHHLLIRAIVDSYTAFGIGSNPLVGLIVYDFTEVLSFSFVMGFKIASPFILTILIINILLGLLSKAMPGMNVFMIGMPLKILVGLFIFMTLMPLYSGIVINIFESMMGFIYKLLGMG